MSSPVRPQRLISADPALAAHLETLILNNRDALIKAAVADQQVQNELLAINAAIQRVSARDPSLVGAWGLGCGAGCAVEAGGFTATALGLGPR